MDDLERLIAVLTPAAGIERARAVVEEACRELQVPHPPRPQHMRAVVSHLAAKSGAIGVAVRLALRREAMGPAAGRPATPAPAPAAGPPVSRATPSGVTVDARRALVELLAPALGYEKAEAAVDETMQRLRLVAPLAARDAERVLSLLADGDGHVATIARFAKARSALGKRGA